MKKLTKEEEADLIVHKLKTPPVTCEKWIDDIINGTVEMIPEDIKYEEIIKCLKKK